MWPNAERGNTARALAGVSQWSKSRGGWTTEGMKENSSLLSALLMVTSVASLVLLSLLCLRCKRKSSSIKEEMQIYNPQTFHRGGSRFAVMRSKTVTRANQITSTTDDRAAQFPAATYSVAVAPSIEDPTYVAPLPIPVYENDPVVKVTEEAPGIYANVDTQSCDDDYENTEFLSHMQTQTQEEEEEDEPDYENQNVDC